MYVALLAYLIAAKNDTWQELDAVQHGRPWLAENRTARRLYDAIHKVEIARMYGGVHDYAYFFIDILVGNPPQRASVIADTGSVLCGFPCSGCRNCGHHIDQAFKWQDSTSFNWVKCKDHASCSCESDGVCHYYQSYTEGSSIGGKLFSDFVRIGDALQHNPSTRVEMGCHQTETKLFVSQKANGIMGLAVSNKNSKPSILQHLFQAVDASVFSMCLAQHGGEMRVGGDAAYYNDLWPSIQWLKPISTSGVYSVMLSKLTIDGTEYSQTGGFGRTIIDSGTTFTYFPSRIFRDMKSKLARFCRSKNLPCSQNCFAFDESRFSELPTMRLTLESVTTNWYPRSYLYPAGSNNRYCYGFEDNGRHGGTVLGATWMIDHQVVFDIKRNRIGVADTSCPTYRQRPNPPTPGEVVTDAPAPLAQTVAPETPTPPVQTAHVAPKTPAPPVQTAHVAPKTPSMAPPTPATSPPKLAQPSSPDSTVRPSDSVILAGGVTLPWYSSIASACLAALLLFVAWVNLCRWCVRRQVAIDSIPLEDWFTPDLAREDYIDNDSEFAIDNGIGVGNDIFLGDSSDEDRV